MESFSKFQHGQHVYIDFKIFTIIVIWNSYANVPIIIKTKTNKIIFFFKYNILGLLFIIIYFSTIFSS